MQQIAKASNIKFYADEMKARAETLAARFQQFSTELNNIINALEGISSDLRHSEYRYEADDAYESHWMVLEVLGEENDFEVWFTTLEKCSSNTSCRDALQGILSNLEKVQDDIDDEDYRHVMSYDLQAESIANYNIHAGAS